MRHLIIILAISTGIVQPVVCQHNAEINEKIRKSLELRELKHADPHRPIYHFVCPESYGQPFDPNGGIFWNGKYHLGYIYQKERNGKFEHVWGHAVSSDLFHWTIYPDMLNIKDSDIENGIFSGGAFLSKDSIPHIIYHGEGSGCNLIAFSTDDDLQTWTKLPENTILRSPSEEDPMFGKYIAWDPECWYNKQTDLYYQISGGNPASFFKSPDMRNWEYLGDFIDPAQRKNKLFEDISCPDFFRIGEKDILLFIGHYLGTQYYMGTFENGAYQVEGYGRMNWPGGTFFAPEQLVDDKGRNIIWGWVIERKPSHLPDYGWSGIMSLPRVLTLSDKNTLQINPPEEIKQLRINETKEEDVFLQGNSEKKLISKGKSMEIKMELKGGTQSPYGLKVFCSPNNKEETVIKYDPMHKEIIIDFICSSIHAPVEFPDYCIPMYMPENRIEQTVTQQRVPFSLAPGETLQLNVFIDRSVIEVFANGKECITQVVYPELPESNGISVFTTGEAIEVRNITTWEMSATNPF